MDIGAGFSSFFPVSTTTNHNTMNKEIKTVSITLEKATKSVEIFRYSPQHSWLCMTPVVVTFPTGNKIHQVGMTQARESNGEWRLTASGFRNANTSRVWAWADQVEANSKW